MNVLCAIITHFKASIGSFLETESVFLECYHKILNKVISQNKPEATQLAERCFYDIYKSRLLKIKGKKCCELTVQNKIDTRSLCSSIFHK